MLNAFFLKSKLLRMSGILLVILSFCIPAFSASLEALGIEQKKVTVNGVVLDDTREPLIGVSVLVKGSQQGTVTDLDGKYSITAPADGTMLIVASGSDDASAGEYAAYGYYRAPSELCGMGYTEAQNAAYDAVAAKPYSFFLNELTNAGGWQYIPEMEAYEKGKTDVVPTFANSASYNANGRAYPAVFKKHFKTGDKVEVPFCNLTEWNGKDGPLVFVKWAALKTDSSAKAITVNNAPITLEAEKYEYDVTVPYNTTATAAVTATDDVYARVSIENNGIKSGVITATITAEDGTATVYTINVTQDVQKTSLTVSAVGGGKITVNGGEATTESTADYEIGTAMTLTAAADEGYKFAYWTDASSNRVVSTEATFEFTIGAIAKEYKATFVSESSDVKVVIFRNKNGQILLNESIAANGSVTVPENPMYIGYDFKGWLKRGNKEISENVTAGATLAYDSVDAGENLFLAQYEKGTDEFTITVTGGSIITEGTTFKYDATVTVKANAAPEGQVFSHWTKDGVTVSYDAEYKFYVSGNTALVAKFVAEADKPAIAPIVSMYEARVLAGNSRIAFFSERSVPEGYTYVGSGIILKSGDAAANADLTLESEGKLVSSSTSQKASGQYLVRKAGLNTGDTWSARAYLTYIDATGKTHTIYSEVVSATY